MFQFGVPVRNAMLDSLLNVVGNGATLRMYSALQPIDIPADCSAPSTGVVLCEIQLPVPWMAKARQGGIAMAGDWQGTGSAEAGVGTPARYFRIFDSGGKNCYVQGTITHTAGGGDMTLDNVSIAQNQTIVVSGFSLTAGNA